MPGQWSLWKSDPRKDPIRDTPLRDPGQSLREQILDQGFDRVGPWLVAAVTAGVLAVLEWIRWATAADPAPVTVTLIAILVATAAIIKSKAALAKIEQLRVGLRGERAVGQYLQSELLPLSYTIIHDICIDDFNIDHVAIGPGGIFAVEVKTRRKPIRGDVQVQYDGVNIAVDGLTPDRNPIVQAQASARRLEEILTKYTGHNRTVRPVVIFPGWFVERQSAGVQVWVLNEKAFVKFIENEAVVLSGPEIRMFSEGLARYVRDRPS